MTQHRIIRTIKKTILDGMGPVFAIIAALIVVAILLLIVGRNPIVTYSGIFTGAFGSWFAFTETMVAASPIMLCGLGVAIAAWVGLMSIGAEGQIYLGAIGASCIALVLPGFPALIVLPLMFITSCLFGALWSGVPGILRVKFGVNETIVTLLLNYVALLLVEYLIHGQWRDPASYGWPQTIAFSHSAELPKWPGTRMHLGISFGIILGVMFWVLFPRTRIGFITRIIGKNPETASYAHYPVTRYLIMAMIISGAVAGLAGFGQVSGIEGRLRTGLSPGYGYTGFLVSWLARHNPLAIIFVAIMIGALMSGSDSLQLSENLPFASINILMGCIFFFLLCSDYFMKKFLSFKPGETDA